jgi:hypothetical protein
MWSYTSCVNSRDEQDTCQDVPQRVNAPHAPRWPASCAMEALVTVPRSPHRMALVDCRLRQLVRIMQTSGEMQMARVRLPLLSPSESPASMEKAILFFPREMEPQSP